MLLAIKAIKLPYYYTASQMVCQGVCRKKERNGGNAVTLFVACAGTGVRRPLTASAVIGRHLPSAGTHRRIAVHRTGARAAAYDESTPMLASALREHAPHRSAGRKFPITARLCSRLLRASTRRTLIFVTGSAIMIKNRKAGIGMKRNLMRIGGLTAGAVLIVLGIVRGEPAEIWEKAVRVCLECIGIG